MGGVAGLAAAPHTSQPGEALLIAAAVVCGMLAAGVSLGPAVRRLATATATGLVAILAGLLVGQARLEAIDAGMLRVEPGSSGGVTGWVDAVPRRADGRVRVEVETADGRVAVEAPEPVGELPVGAELSATGRIREPSELEAAYLERHGVARILQARSIRLTGAARGGPAGALDSVRNRAEAALGTVAADGEAALLRGFVLGQDDRIDPLTVDEFKRSGLAHLLAVSGQNIVLLAILATGVLALAGVSLRNRLLIVVALIAIYVPVAGAGPSIQRAGVMGIAGLVAALASRPASRWYAVGLAALVTLALDPRATADVGWQLSFAAVVGILLLVAPLRRLLLPPAPAPATPIRRALCEGLAVTLAASLATAPLMAHHFDAVSVTSLLANLLVLPAVAPVMWLGMAAALLGQLPWLPVEPLVWLASHLVAYIAQVAHWLAAPDWAQLEAGISSPLLVAAIYAVTGCAIGLTMRSAARRHGLATAAGTRLVLSGGLAAALAGWVAIGLLGGAGGIRDRVPGLRVSVLDVGQGDAILLEPRGAEPVLVDTGPPGSSLMRELGDLGIERLAALAISHDESDHSGGMTELLDRVETDSLAFGLSSPSLRRAARAYGMRALPLARGSELRFGELRLEVLWPPRELIDPGSEALVGGPGVDRNNLSLVMLARWRDFELLLTGDAEAEAVPMAPGPIDALKLSHHGSDDAGLDELLAQARPELGLISVGEANSYGHPTPATLSSLAEHGVETLRTDESGRVVIDVTRGGWELSG
ncbi:MAG: ComEC/Rec2 family competence protein [Solirubrobacterales bacterium]|nr:ComEC/Rec2 family competence protein [Solirubrobacterales bacterium]